MNVMPIFASAFGLIGAPKSVKQLVPGALAEPPRYADDWRGWPVAPVDRQHPIRGAFLDPRPDPRLGAVYHDGIDIGVRDDRPEPGAPRGRTHRVYAIESGAVAAATPRGVRGAVEIGHFRYEHVDALVVRGDQVRAGEVIGWTCFDTWHVHLTEFAFLDGRPVLVNPLRPGGKLRPYVDRAPPAIEEIRFYTPASPAWERRTGNVVRLPPAGRRLDKRQLRGRVDARVRASDPQSFIGFFEQLPWLAAPHHPFRLAVTVVRSATGATVRHADVFRSEQMLERPAGTHFAPGTEQNLPANACMRLHRTVRCDGIYWFRLFPDYWDTTRLPNGRYRLQIDAWDTVGNTARATTEVNIDNDRR
jgi:hypothetical protein